MSPVVVGTRFGLSLGIGQVEVFASAAAKAAVLEAERAAQVACGLPEGLVRRPARLSELLVTPDTTRAGVQLVLADIAQAQAQLHALQAAAISHLAVLQPAQQSLPGARHDDDPADPDRADDWVADEVAVVLGVAVGSASVLVDKQRVLMEQLPAVWVALADGRIDVRRAQVLVDALAHRKRSAGGGLADEVVDAVTGLGLRWIAEGIGPTPLTERIAAALIAADPAEADRRAARRKRRQNVTTSSCGDGLAGLRADLLDAADAAAIQAVIDAMAAVMRKNGDRRPIGVLRVAALKQLLTRPWEALSEDVASACWQLRLQVDLADLDDLGTLLNPPDNTDLPDGTARSEELTGLARGTTESDSTAPRDGTDVASDTGNTDLLDGADGIDGSDLTDPAGEADLPDGSAVVEGRADGTGLPGAVAQRGGAAQPDGSEVGGGSGSGVGAIGGLAVSPVAVAELLARYDALLVTHQAGRVAGGEVWFEIIDTTGRLRAITSPAQARAAVRRGTGLGPPPAIDRYTPSAAQVRFVKARDRHCRFPGCARPAEYVDLDHVVPRDHQNPAAGGPTCITNLVCLCRRHHRLKTHAPGWVFAMDPDGTLHVTPPGGRTRTTRPTCIAEADMSTPTSTDAFTDLLGPTPNRYRSPTPEERTARRAAAAERARLAADIEAELTAAYARLTAEHGAEQVDDRPEQSSDQDQDQDQDQDPGTAGDDPAPF